MGEVAVSVRGLGKQYRILHQQARYGRLTESVAGLIRTPFDRLRGRSREEGERFWALKEVGFDIEVGEVVGIVGRNGAGKSTLLKVLSRITEPTEGRAVLTGRVAALLEVGTGFHPELTGRENIFLSGSILGMRRSEIERRFDEIVAFADLERFLDTPVKRYSSGMSVRLGFAVAAHLEPEILLVDEVLAVGDVAFQEKCLGKMKDIAGQGRTVVFVSHNMGAVGTLCPTSLWLEHGRVRMLGSTTDVIPEYVQASTGGAETGEIVLPVDGSKEVQVGSVRILSPSGDPMPVGECKDPITVELAIDVRQQLRGLYAYLEVQAPSGMTVLVSDSADTNPNPLDGLPEGRHFITATIPSRTLAPGRYNVYVSLASLSGRKFNVDVPGIVGSFRLHDSWSRRGNARAGFHGALLRWDVSSAPLEQSEVGA